jgi:hypothetical protein
MKRTRIAAVASLTASAGLLGLTLGIAPAQADPTDSFLNALGDSGLTGIDPGNAVAVGQSVCPMLSEGGQNVADVAASVSDSIGRPLGPATMFTGLAITIFCPGAVQNIANGQSPLAGLPLGLLG